MNDLYEYAGPLQPEELHCVVTPDCLKLVGGGKAGRGRSSPAAEQRVKVRLGGCGGGRGGCGCGCAVGGLWGGVLLAAFE